MKPVFELWSNRKLPANLMPPLQEASVPATQISAPVTSTNSSGPAPTDRAGTANVLEQSVLGS